MLGIMRSKRQYPMAVMGCLAHAAAIMVCSFLYLWSGQAFKPLLGVPLLAFAGSWLVWIFVLPRYARTKKAIRIPLVIGSLVILSPVVILILALMAIPVRQ